MEKVCPQAYICMLHCMWWSSQMQKSSRLRCICSYFWRCRKCRKFEFWSAIHKNLAQTQAQRPTDRQRENHAAKSPIEAASWPASLPARQAASQLTRQIGTGRQTTHQLEKQTSENRDRQEHRVSDAKRQQKHTHRHRNTHTQTQKHTHTHRHRNTHTQTQKQWIQGRKSHGSPFFSKSAKSLGFRRQGLP